MLTAVRSVVAFGGGTGLGRLLSALAQPAPDAPLSPLGERLVGVVTTTDDGGSTGRLRRATGSIAWGDLRNCFNQICREPTLGRLLFEYRFVDSGELSGHNLGNLMLLALDQLTARPLDAINLVRDLLEVQPRLLPMSEQPAALVAEADGERVAGETTVDALPAPPRRLWLEPDVAATPEILEAIAGADLILMGPGSFVTSVMPSLLVAPIRAAVAAARCPRVLIANLAAEQGPTGALDLAAQLGWMERILGARLVDAVLWPASRPLPDEARPAPPVRVHVADVAAPRGAHHRGKLVEGLAALLEGLGG